MIQVDSYMQFGTYIDSDTYMYIFLKFLGRVWLEYIQNLIVLFTYACTPLSKYAPASPAPPGVPDQAAPVADVDLEGVRGGHEPLLQQHGGPVGDQAVSLHLPEPQSALPGAALRRLAGEHRAGPARTPVHLVHHHVLQLLVVHGAVVDVRLEERPVENTCRQRRLS